MANSNISQRFSSIDDIFRLHNLFKEELYRLICVLETVRRIKLGYDKIISVVLQRFEKDDFFTLNQIMDDSGVRYDVYNSFYKDFLFQYKKENWYKDNDYYYPTYLKLHINNELLEFLYKPLEVMPLYINYQLWKGRIAKWRLRVGK